MHLSKWTWSSLILFVLQHLLIEQVISAPTPSNAAMMSTPTRLPEREIIKYRVPSSTITLELILNEAQPVSSSVLDACLSGALAEARRQSQSSLVEGVFEYSTSSPGGLNFGIIGGLHFNELTWSDVVVIIQGLQSFYAERRQYVAMLIFLEDEQRGALGSASLEPDGSGASTSSMSDTQK